MADIIQSIIPTYHRHLNLARLKAEMLLAGGEAIFVAHHTDTRTLNELDFLSCEYVIDYAQPSGVNAANRGYQAVTSKWFVMTQDDIVHQPGWLEEAKKLMPEAKVIGLNDMSTTWSVAWLMQRDQEFVAGLPGVVFNPAYTKNYADNELNDYAKYRGVWAYADKAHAEHMHPGFGKANMDYTYTRLEQDASKDAELYRSRQHLWH